MECLFKNGGNKNESVETIVVDMQALPSFRRALMKWHRQYGRQLPWRNLADPYRVWISEVMLQQTTVAAVKPYFERFLQRFPTVHDLASGSEAEVLRLWEGLGYYSRARNLHAAAKEIAEQLHGEFPTTLSGLTSLPGIGRYTAGAILSFAMNRPAPIVEANTLRLYSRLIGLEIDPRSTTGQTALWSFAERVLPSKNPGEFNQALMDLGATVCTPKSPRCEECPVKKNCAAFRADSVDSIPMLAKRAKITPVTEVAIIVEANGTYLLRQCQPGERWAGLWDFPRFALHDEATSLEQRFPEIEARLLAMTAVSATIERQIAEFTHSVTRFRIRLICLTASLRNSPTKLKASAEQRWVTADEFAQLALPVTGRKIAQLLHKSRFNRQ